MNNEIEPHTDMATDEALSIEVPETFCVKDEATANWVIRKIVEARQYAQRVQAWADRELQRARQDEKFILFRFGSQLESWVRAEMTSKAIRRKSFSLPAGTVGFRLAPMRTDIRDEQALLAWCKLALPSAVVIRESLSKRAIFDHIEKTGELPTGCEIVASHEMFFIK